MKIKTLAGINLKINSQISGGFFFGVSRSFLNPLAGGSGVGYDSHTHTSQMPGERVPKDTQILSAEETR